MPGDKAAPRLRLSDILNLVPPAQIVLGMIRAPIADSVIGSIFIAVILGGVVLVLVYL
jgi:hypothetical protein